MPQILNVTSEPGIRRDGTQFDGTGHIDGQWVRWQRKRPRKMWGYRSVTTELTEISRGLHVHSADGQMYLHSGGVSALQQIKTDRFGVLQQLTTRTPVAGFVASADNVWQFDLLRDATSGTQRLIAHAAPSLANIDSTTATSVFFGDVRGTATLGDTGIDVSGGIVCLHPYLIAFGSDGLFKWSVPNKPDDFTNVGSGTAYVTGGKILVGRRVRGTGSGPAGLLWTQDALVRVAFTTSGTTWNVDELAETSLMSSRAVVEYDGQFYWPGVDRFYTFSGVQRELPNDMNFNFFFDNVNMTHRQKVFGFKNPHWGEIWWCFPFGNATEANHAIIMNLREGTWYDTALPNDGRSAAAYAQTYPRPFMTGVKLRDSAYTLWQHETGLDEADGSTVQGIRSYYETGEVSLLASDKPQDGTLKTMRIEPDMIQSGDVVVSVQGRQNFRAPEVPGEEKVVPEVVSGPSDETVPVREVRRLLRFRFESDQVGGDMQAGATLAHVDMGDKRIQS